MMSSRRVAGKAAHDNSTKLPRSDSRTHILVRSAGAAMNACDAECTGRRRGQIIGSVELYDCTGDGEEWMLRDLKRLTPLIAPALHPQPVWFYPFSTVGETPEELLIGDAAAIPKNPS